MGCLKLSYQSAERHDDHQKSHSLEQSTVQVKRGDEYYPFGLQTAESWTRVTDTENNFLFNAASEMNQSTGMYETFFRQYDPTLGRFGAVDPMADKYGSLNPYNFAFNDPVYYNDPLGDDPETAEERRQKEAQETMKHMRERSGRYRNNPVGDDDMFPKLGSWGGGMLYGGMTGWGYSILSKIIDNAKQGDLDAINRYAEIFADFTIVSEYIGTVSTNDGIFSRGKYRHIEKSEGFKKYGWAIKRKIYIPAGGPANPEAMTYDEKRKRGGIELVCRNCPGGNPDPNTPDGDSNGEVILIDEFLGTPMGSQIQLWMKLKKIRYFNDTLTSAGFDNPFWYGPDEIWYFDDDDSSRTIENYPKGIKSKTSN